jgi:thiol-disulfide isomerase/thioredoxin
MARANEITPEADQLLKQVASTATAMKSLKVQGALRAQFDVAGMKNSFDKPFTAQWISSGAFQMAVAGEVEVGFTGSKFYEYGPQDKLYAQRDEKSSPGKLPNRVHDLMIDQNLQLLLAGQSDAPDILKKKFGKIRTGDAVAIDGKSYPTIVMEDENRVMTALVDASTNTLRQVRTDPTRELKTRGATAIKTAEIVVDYTAVQPNVDIKPEAFAWAPPAGAREVEETAAEDGKEGASKALEGKPAPAFTLKSLQDKDTALADYKGKVVVLDFWATWCGPCVASLPHLDKLAKEKADDGVVVFAVNLEEEKDDVQKFITKKKLSLNVLLDTDGAVGKQYKATAIPQTVVIGKDGVVKKVFVGISPEGPGKGIDAAVDAAVKE